MDQNAAPVLEALARYREADELPFTPPGHKQARGADPQVREVLGDAVFHGDVLASGAWTTGAPGAGCWAAPSG